MIEIQAWSEMSEDAKLSFISTRTTKQLIRYLNYIHKCSIIPWRTLEKEREKSKKLQSENEELRRAIEVLKIS